MKYIISGKNVEITSALRERATVKISKLEKFFTKDTEVHIMMNVQKSRHTVEVTIPFNGYVLRAEETEGDMYASIDKVVDILLNQIKKYRTKLAKRVHNNTLKLENIQFSNDEDEDEDEDFKIIRSKKFEAKPMDAEEAILQMNLRGYDFFAFLNPDTKNVNVVYKRHDGNYGLIEPES